MNFFNATFLTALLIACGEKESTEPAAEPAGEPSTEPSGEPSSEVTDADGDGVPTEEDCNDDDASMPNDDADCDGVLTAADCDDNDPESTAIAQDEDCDGVLTADDCDDNDNSSTTIATDADCDGTLTADDCDDNNAASTTVATDADCDGVLTAADCNDNDTTSTIVADDADCDGVLTAADCDDSDATSTTIATDADCDGTITTDDCNDNDSTSTIVTTDADCDGVLTADDCDDNDNSSTTIATDADCDGTLTADDCDDSSATSTTLATDADCDGVLTAADCNDNDATVYPGATEIWYNGVDNDCSGNASDYDQDGDGEDALANGGSDCNDTDANTLNNTYYLDADGDSWGDPNPALSTVACTLPTGYADNDQDCNDDSNNGGANIHPNATEVCDDIDNDCDGNIDDDDTSLDSSTGTLWYADNDADGDGDPSSTMMACEMPANHTDNGDDCDDNDATAYLGATEIWYNGVDNDCSGNASDYDQDGDGFDASNHNGTDCDDTDASTIGDEDGDGFTYCTNDCNDTVGTGANIHPNATEVCDDIDNDCDGDIDDDDTSLDSSTGTLWYADNDGDTFGNANSTTMACEMPSSYSDNGDDCDDTDEFTFLGAADVEDPNACMTDFDDDGWGDANASGNVVAGTDCDDSTTSVSPDVLDDGTAAVDGIDNDCDGFADEDSYLGISLLAAGDLIITEVMPDPVAVSDANGEWFEIYNDTGVGLNLNGLGFMDDGSDDFTVTSDLYLPAGEYLVFAKNGDFASNGGVNADYEYGAGMGLTNTSDELYIYTATDFIDSIAWDNGATFPNPAGASISLSPGTSAADNDNGFSWCESTSTYGDGDFGTPGEENDTCPAPLSYASDIAPLLGGCMGCHGSQFLSSYGTLMSAHSGDWRGNNASANMPLITAGDPSQSYLFQKISGTQSAGGQMFTSASTVSMVEQWINEGAQP